jgi:phytanoyl-CoA hydroxylase
LDIIYLNIKIQGSVKNLKESINKIVSNFDFSTAGEVFTTKEQSRAAGDYFLTSGDKIRFFWEEKAWLDGKLIQSPELAINKIGHNLHDLEPAFEDISYDKRVGKICKDLGMEIPKVVQSM